MNFYYQLKKFGHKVCIITENNSYSYNDLIKYAEKINFGVPERSIILTFCNNSFEFIASYVGFLRNKSIQILLDENINLKSLNKIIKLYKPNYIFLPQKKNFKKSGLVKKIGKFCFIKTKYLNKNLNIPKELGLLLSTSGSIGSPKFVKISYSNLNFNTNSIAKYLKISPKDRLITTLNPSYTYGLSKINSHLSMGASILVSDYSLLEKNFWKLLKKKKVNNFGGVPFSYEILRKLKFEKMKFKKLKYITQAGGKLNEELHKWINQVCKSLKIKFFVMYGATEATSRMSFLDWKYSKKIGSIGKPIPGGKMWLLDNLGKKIKKTQTVGRIVYQGKNVALGYANNYFDLFKRDQNKGILLTGDLAYRDNQNFYYIFGRESRFIKIIGNRINLDELQNKMKIKNINCACDGIDDLMKIFIENIKEEKKVIKFFSKETIINSKYYKIIKINKIPRNKNGKILYSKFKNLSYN